MGFGPGNLVQHFGFWLFPRSPVQCEQQLIPTLHLPPCFLRGKGGCWKVQDRSNVKDNLSCFSFRFAREGRLGEREVMGLGLTWRELLRTGRCWCCCLNVGSLEVVIELEGILVCELGYRLFLWSSYGWRMNFNQEFGPIRRVFFFNRRRRF